MYAGAHLYKTGKMSLIKEMIFSDFMIIVEAQATGWSSRILPATSASALLHQEKNLQSKMIIL